jgi:hypothetical protein
MRWVRFLTCCVGLVAALALVGCGGGSGTIAGTNGAAGTAPVTDGAGGDGGATTVGPSAAAGTTAGGGNEAIHEPVQSRGIKGEDPTTEAATRARLSAADCAALGRLAGGALGTNPTRRSNPSASRGTKLARHSDTTPPLSRCRLSGHGTEVNVFLDTGFAAHQRYANRIAETVQFNTQHPAGLPRPVPDVGEKAAYNADASWIPALRSLLAVRGNRWLTVTISVAGMSSPRLRDEAAVLASAGFRLSAS